MRLERSNRGLVREGGGGDGGKMVKLRKGSEDTKVAIDRILKSIDFEHSNMVLLSSKN